MTALFKFHVLVSGAIVLAVGATAFANPPPWAGGGKKSHQEESSANVKISKPEIGVSVDIRIGNYIGGEQRDQVRAYYKEEGKKGKCPPGLAKKGNGCQPPGQAKKWAMGQPLGKDVVYEPIDSRISVRLGVPPKGTKYVRVAQDILLIAIGTAMVLDAIEDLGR